MAKGNARRIRFNVTRYCSSKNKEWKIYSSGEKIKYITREEAILKHSRKPNNGSLTNYLLNQRLELPENDGLMLFNFETNSVEYPSVKESIKEFKKLDRKQFVWDGEISISKKDANELRFGTQEDFGTLVMRYMPSFLKAEGIDPKNVSFYAAVHANTENPHLHWVFFEKEPSIYDEKNKDYGFRKKGKLHLENIQKFETLAWNYLIYQDRIEKLFRDKSEFWANKNEIKAELKNYKFDQLNTLALNVIDEVKNDKNVKFANLSDESKNSIMEYFENELLELPDEIQDRYNDHLEFLEKYPNDQHFKKEHEQFKNWIGNKVLKDIKEAYIPKNNFISFSDTNENKFLDNAFKMESYLSEYDYKQKQEYLNKFRKIQKEIEREKASLKHER